MRRDQTLLQLRPDGIVHKLHALGLAADDGVLQLLGGSLADDGSHRTVDHENFVHRDTTAAVLTFEQELRDHAAQGRGQHGANLGLLVRWEDVNHTVDGLSRIVGVEGAKNEQTGFSSSQRKGDRFEIAHLANQHDVGVFPQRRLQPGRKVDRMLRDFALGDDAFLVRMDEFDRFFHGHDVPGEVCVDVVHQGRQRGALAGTRRAGDEDKAAAQVAEFFDHRRQGQFLERGNARRDQAEDRAEAVHLFEVVAAEAAVLIHLVGEVEIAFVLETFPVFRRADLAQHVVHLFRREDLLADGDNVAMTADFRRLSLGKVQIGRTRGDQDFEKLVDVGHGIRVCRRAVS